MYELVDFGGGVSQFHYFPNGNLKEVIAPSLVDLKTTFDYFPTGDLHSKKVIYLSNPLLEFVYT